MDQSDNEILMLSYKNPARFADLFDRHHGRFLAIAKKALGSRDLAEDAVQETFVRIYKYGKKFLGSGGDFRPWSNGILRNAIIDQARKKQAKEVPLTPEMENVLSTENNLAEMESRDSFNTVMRKLNAAAAEILNLRFVLGKSFKEIGRILGVGSSAARVRVFRAKKEFIEIHKELNANIYEKL